MASQSLLGCGSVLTPAVCAGEPDEVVDVDEDKVGEVFWGDVGDKLEMVFKEDEDKVLKSSKGGIGDDKLGIVVKGEDDKFANNNDEDKFRLLINIICVVS